MSVAYICLASFRVFSAVLFQNGYVHPDEFFQTTEIITGDTFGVVHNRSWEFNNSDAPVRSIGLLQGIFGIPLFIAKWIFELYQISWNPFLLLFVYRLVTCAISFITDYSLYKICKILKLKYNKCLILLSSSYVIIVFGTRTFTNSIELALVSLLLWRVIDSMLISQRVLAAKSYIENMYSHKTSITDKVILSRKIRQLPSHHFCHCFEIGTILAMGTFNRPTFLLFAVTPIFYWLSRGFSKNYNNFVRIFNLRFLVLLLCVLPGAFLCILIDSLYFGRITDDEANFVITPLNFIKYNINPSNLAEHGIHFRLTHAIVNTPLLFNILTLFFLGRLQLNSLIRIIINRHYHLLPNIQEVNTLMMGNVIIPLCLLSIFPHQEPRFLLPLLLPIVFTTSKYFSSHYIKEFHYVLPIWCFSNIIGLIFFGHLHQAGIIPMISHVFHDIKNASNIHIVHSHTYSIPIGLLLIPQVNESMPYAKQRHIKIHNLGSSLDPDVVHETVINITKLVNHKENHIIYFALSGPLTKQFELFCSTSNLVLVKTNFFPHVSMESLKFYLTSLIQLIHKNQPYFVTLIELCDIFSLVLYKITTKTE